MLNSVVCNVAEKSLGTPGAGISCGLKCGKTLRCGLHKCDRMCHGDCCEEIERKEKEGKKKSKIAEDASVLITPSSSSSSQVPSTSSSPLIGESEDRSSSPVQIVVSNMFTPCHMRCDLPLPFCGHPCTQQFDCIGSVICFLF
jgi:hypothetical protein